MNPVRREFLRLGLGSCALLACGRDVPGFLARTAEAADPPERGTGRVLVVLELNGGNDGLNTVVPFGDDLYRKHRPKLALASNTLHKLDDHMGVHPALRNFKELYDDGRLAIVQSVGYPNASRSHFESMDVWQTAVRHPQANTPGWLSRGSGLRNNASDGDGTALHIGEGELPRALVGDVLSVPSLTRLDQVVRRIGQTVGSDQVHRARLDRVATLPRGEPGSHLEFLQRSQVVTYASSARIEETLRRQARGGGDDFPASPLAQRMKLVAQLIKAGLTTSIYYVQLEGFDTHQNQLPAHAALLGELAGAVSAFFADLENSGEARRVVLLAFSEFGRRLAENASRGTDHGTAAPVFLAGPSVRAGLHGPYPNLRDLDDGDPRFAIDFRRVYATLLDRWLNCPSRVVLGEEFTPLGVL